MGRFCNGLMIVFRILQLILSLTALACGVFITYTMFSMSTAAHHIESSIESLNNPSDRQKIETSLGSVFTHLNITDSDVQGYLGKLDTLLNPILHIMEGTPWRAIILSAVSLWSICIIIYLLIAQRATSSPRMNKRSIRITLELLTLILWAAGIVCVGLLAGEYGGIVFTGGVELKFAWTSIKPIITEALKSLVKDGNVLQELSIVNDIFTIGALSILAVVAACICGAVSFVSLLAACCISGKSKKKDDHRESGAVEYLLSE